MLIDCCLSVSINEASTVCQAQSQPACPFPAHGLLGHTEGRECSRASSPGCDPLLCPHPAQRLLPAELSPGPKPLPGFLTGHSLNSEARPAQGAVVLKGRYCLACSDKYFRDVPDSAAPRWPQPHLVLPSPALPTPPCLLTPEHSKPRRAQTSSPHFFLKNRGLYFAIMP